MAGTPKDRECGDVYRRLRSRLFIETCVPHEAAATYLSIQGLPSSGIMKSSLRDLSSDYRAYYNAMAGVIDPCCSHSWLRYCAGWTLIHWSFSSLRARQFFQNVEPREDILSTIAGPESRFETARKVLKSTRKSKKWLKHAIDRASSEFTSLGRKPWNFFNETEWYHKANGQDFESVRLFENILTSALGDWLISEMPFETDDIDHAECPLGPGFDEVTQYLKLQVVKIRTTSTSVLDKNWNSAQIERMGISHGSDSIKLRPCVKPKDISNEYDKNAIRNIELSSDGTEWVTILLNANDEKLTILLRSLGSNSMGSREIGSFIVTSDIGSRIIDYFSNSVKNVSSIFVIARGKRHEFQKLLEMAKNIGVFTLNNKTNVVEKRKNVVFNIYLDSDWSELYRLKIVSQNLKVHSHTTRLLDDADRDGKPISIRIAGLFDNVGIYILAVKPDLSGYRIDQYEEQLITDSKLGKLEISEQEIAGIVRSLVDAWHVWDTF
jgi:hypothetical protein